jgi:DNA helicase-2/ATP-dependent DNA helicase PcrA
MENNEKFLEDMIERLNNRIARINVTLEEGAKEVGEMHDYYWENYTEMDEYGYENFDNQQALLGQINSNNEQLALKQRFVKMLDSPYFGRVDFQFEDEDEPESFYIGIGNFSEEAGKQPLIYDWRAPVSSLFYDFDKGAASYQAPGGSMEGEITSKWQYKIRSGKLIYAFESDVKIDDDVLKQELGSNGDVKLKNIVRTIQKEQNAIIRNVEDKIMVIQGVAGSGKTSVALHRIAYILYHNRSTIKASNILILSPNGVFADYISHILPELGEENIMEMSFDTFAYRELSDTISDYEDRYDQIERELSGDPQDLYHEKQTKEYMQQLNGYVLELEDSLMRFRNFSYHGMEKSSQEIRDLFYNKFPDIPLLKRMDAVMEYIVDEYETLRGKDFEDDERAIIASKFYKMYRTMDLYKIYNEFLLSAGLPLLPQVPFEQRTLKYEDMYPMLYLRYQLYGRSRRHGNIRHLIIDEMQDYSYLQYTILEQLFSCRMTILGDKAQTMDDKEQDVTTFLPKILGKGIRMITMNKSYRNTVEIASYANSISSLSQMELFERHGLPVQKLECADQKAALDEVLLRLKLIQTQTEDGFETAAVITTTQQQAKAAYEYLQTRLEEDVLSYVDRDTKHFKKGLVVTTFYYAKGLEFDQVFALRTKGDNRPIHRQADYITATRALHELHVITV